MAKDVTVTIDGIPVSVPEGTLVVEAAKLVQVDVPVYCYHPKLGPAGLCRICLVEIEKTPKLQIACNTVATEGMVVHTYSDAAREGRRAVLELLLLNHPLDCPICDKGGECDLQDFAMAYGSGFSRLADSKLQKPKAVDLGPTIVLDEERCIVCQRCTRFDEIVTNERSIVVKDRGHHDLIATATGEPYVSDFSGNVTELCPVGALTSKTYRFKSRPWDLQRTKTTCQQCSVGCAINVDVRHHEILRTMSVAEDPVSDGWLCDRGRYNIAFYSDPRRLVSPMLRLDDSWTEIAWDDAIELWARKLQDAIAAGGPAGIAAIGGGRLTNEEAYLLARIFRGIGVESVDHRAGRQYRATPSKAGSTYDDVVQAQTIFLLGRPPSQTAPILDLHVRKAVTKNGARLIAIGPHSAGSFVPSERYSNASEVPADAFAVERVVGIWDGVDLTFADGLYERLHGGDHTPVSIGLLIPGDQPNARGAEAMGMLPREGALDTRGIFEAARDGKIRVLSLFGVNPLLRFADGRLARAALDGSAFTVVSDLFMTETAQQADLVLPARATFEKSGHVTSLTGATTALARAQLAPLGTLSDLEMLIALAAEIGVPVPSARELETAATSYRSEIVPRELFATAPPPASGDGAAPRAALRVAFAENAFSGGCTARFDGSVDALRPRPTATLAPKTAAALGLAPGDLVDLELDGNPILRGLTVRIDDELEVGTVALIDALPEAPANVIAPSATLSLAARRPTRVGVPA